MLGDILILAAEPAKQAAAAGGAPGTEWAQILLSIVGPAGLIGAFVALFKLKPDANSQAVTQAQGAASEWQKIADERQRENDRLRVTLSQREHEIERLQNLLHPPPAPPPTP